MAEIEVRLSQLRTAAGVFLRASRQLQQATHNVGDITRELQTLGLDEYTVSWSVSLVGLAEPGQSLADHLWDFGSSLQLTADAVERATQTALPHFDTSLLPAEPQALAKPLPVAAAVPVLPLVSLEPGQRTYISQVNAPLYEDWQARRDLLTRHQQDLLMLQKTRQQTGQQLAAVQNRLSSLGPDPSPTADPQVVALQTRIAALDGEIESMAGAVGPLESEVGVLETRLARVLPGATADLTTIQALEGSQSPQWLVDNTYDCVQHVVERVPIPGGVAGNAAGWAAVVEKAPQFGIQSGDVPLPGAVLVMQPDHSYADDVYGHLMVVERVDGPAVWVTDNNHPDVPVRLDALTTEVSGEHLTYLYLPWHTRA